MDYYLEICFIPLNGTLNFYSAQVELRNHLFTWGNKGVAYCIIALKQIGMV